jgi:hypothetical protein
MKLLIAGWITTLVKLLFFVPTVYYITPSGSGSGTGLDSANTMSYAALFSKPLNAGDSVKFKGGNTYSGQHYAKDGAIYGRYSSGTNPVISGMTTLSSWTNSSGNIWYATATASAIQSVTVDGVLKGLGRYPNTGYLIYTSHTGNTSISGTSVSGLPTSFVGGEVVIRKARYIMDRHIITAQSGSTITYSSTNFYGNSSNYDPDNGNGYFIQGHLSTLDQDGEWYFDQPNSRLYMYFSGSTSGRVVKASTVNQLVPLNSTVDVTFNNVDFEGGNVGIQNNGTSNIIFNNCNFKNQGTAIYGVDCTNLTMIGGSITDCGSNGVNIESSDVANITGSKVIGVTLTRTGIIPGLGESGDGRYSSINIGGNNTTITDCTVRKSGFNGIGFDGDNVFVARNFVDSSCLVKDDGGGIYCYTPSGVTRSNRIIRKNIVLNSIGNFDGAAYNGELYGQAGAIYLDGFSNHVTVDSNFCATGNWMGIFENGNSYNSILNNTTYDFVYGVAVTQTATSGFGSVRNLLMTGNKFIARSPSQFGLLLTILFVNDDPVNFGTIDYNNYSRPIDDDSTIMVNRGGYVGSTGLTTMTLANWKTISSVDASSTNSSVTATSLGDMRYDYNYSATSSTISLPGVYKDVLGNAYSGTATLTPYSGKVFVYTEPVPAGFFMIRVGPYQFVKP